MKLVDKWSILVHVEDPTEAAFWLQENLFFKRLTHEGAQYETKDMVCLINENLIIDLRKGSCQALESLAPNQYYSGLAHFALRTDNIHEALSWCKKQRLQIELKTGNPFFNPRVFGDGTYYFHVISPFGLKIEISQRIGDQSPYRKSIISGLCHLGLPVSDLNLEMAFFNNLGFSNQSEPIINNDDIYGPVQCCMLSRRYSEEFELTLEIYQLLDSQAIPLPDSYCLKGLQTIHQSVISPGGIQLIHE